MMTPEPGLAGAVRNFMAAADALLETTGCETLEAAWDTAIKMLWPTDPGPDDGRLAEALGQLLRIGKTGLCYDAVEIARLDLGVDLAARYGEGDWIHSP